MENGQKVKSLYGLLLSKQIGIMIFEYMKVIKFAPNNSDCIKIAECSKVQHTYRQEIYNIQNEIYH